MAEKNKILDTRKEKLVLGAIIAFIICIVIGMWIYTEVVYKGANDPLDEGVELHNIVDEPVDITIGSSVQ